jgi:trans-aconitate methyltransferase
VDLVEFDAKEGKKLTVLDIGCGSGELTRQIAGIVGVAEVVGIDLDRNMIDKANEEQLSQGETNIKFQVGDIRSYRCNLHFDVVFSNAALHWIPPQDMERAVKSIADSLAPQGQLVLEMGGKGNVASIIEATQQAIPSSKSPWCFPSVGEMASLLEKYNVEVTSAQLFDRPTPLEDGKEGVSNWLRMFGVAFFEGMDNDDVEKALVKINEILVSTKPDLFDGNCWMADYRRLRIVAKKTK